MCVPSKIHNILLVKIQPEERLAATSELNLASRLVTGCGDLRPWHGIKWIYFGEVLKRRFVYEIKRPRKDKKLPVVLSQEEVLKNQNSYMTKNLIYKNKK